MVRRDHAHDPALEPAPRASSASCCCVLLAAGIAMFFLLGPFYGIVATAIAAFIDWTMFKILRRQMRTTVTVDEDGARFNLYGEERIDLSWPEVTLVGLAVEQGRRGRRARQLFFYKEDGDRLMVVPAEFDRFAGLEAETRRLRCRAFRDIALEPAKPCKQRLRTLASGQLDAARRRRASPTPPRVARTTRPPRRRGRPDVAIAGKLIGALVGSIAGPLGTLFGGFIGHLFDRAVEERRAAGAFLPGMEAAADPVSQAQVNFLTCLIGLSIAVANTEGRVRQSQIDAMKAFFRDHLPYGPADQELIQRLIDGMYLERDRIDVEALCAYFRGTTSPEARLLLLRLLGSCPSSTRRLAARPRRGR